MASIWSRVVIESNSDRQAVSSGRSLIYEITKCRFVVTRKGCWCERSADIFALPCFIYEIEESRILEIALLYKILRRLLGTSFSSRGKTKKTIS